MKETSIVGITVIIPCYNDGIYINGALDSVLNQTLLPEKIIIIDDGSNEETLEILREIQSPIVQIIYQENTGVCTARNRAIDNATTEYILTLDADDYFERTFIEKAFNVVSSQANVGVVCCYYQGFKIDNSLMAVIKPLGGLVNNFLVQNNGLGNCLFRKACWEKVNGYDVRFDKGYEDWDFWISILKNGWEMHVIPEVLFKYRIKDVSRDQTAVALYDQELKMKLYDKHKEVYQKYAKQVYALLIYKNSKLKNKIAKTQSTLDYRLGASLLKPIRFIKKLFN